MFIGQSLNKEKLVAALDSCLMTAEEDAVSGDHAFAPWPSREIINGLTPVLFTTTTLDGWLDPQSLQHSGLLVQRNLKGKFDQFRADIDAAVHRLGIDQALSITVMNTRSKNQQLCESVKALLSEAALPESLSTQICSDACALAEIVGSLLPSARELEIKLEIFGAVSCSRWHRDSYAGRAIVSYTGETGTEYIRDGNVDMWQLENRGDNESVVKDDNKICAVDTGDFFFIKGALYPQGTKGIVHKAPEKMYHEDGRILNRLVLKVDVQELQDWEFSCS